MERSPGDTGLDQGEDDRLDTLDGDEDDDDDEDEDDDDAASRQDLGVGE